MIDSKKPENQKWEVCHYIFDKKWVDFNRLWVNRASIRMIVKLGPKNELQNLGFGTYYNHCGLSRNSKIQTEEKIGYWWKIHNFCPILMKLDQNNYL